LALLPGRCCIRATLAPIAGNAILLMAHKSMVFQLNPATPRIDFSNEKDGWRAEFPRRLSGRKR
jgi:hypothetical protein